MNRQYILLMGALLLAGSVQSQQVDSVLAKVAKNNKILQAEKQRIEAAKTGFKTGLTLYDPQVSYDFLKGFPAAAGNQNDLSVVQAFDFPTVYGNRKNVSNLKITQTDFEARSATQEILLQAKLIAIQLVYLNKRNRELQQRMRSAEQFYADYQKKFDRQDATILDINKARLLLTNLKTDVKLLATERAEFMQKLAELNGCNAIDFTDTTYPAAPVIPDFETLEQTIEASDPTLKYYEAQQQIGQAEMKLSKSLRLPKMELGYHYQGILGQRFHGAHLGFSVPLWENRNKVKYQQTQTTFYGAQVEAHRTEHFSAIKQLYDKYKELQINLDEYRQSLQSFSSYELLNKALQAGQLTTLQYYMEVSLIYESKDRYLLLEFEASKALAQLYKYIL